MSGTLEVGIRLVWGDSPPLAEPGGGSWRESLGCGSPPKMLESETSPLQRGISSKREHMRRKGAGPRGLWGPPLQEAVSKESRWSKDSIQV